MSRGLIAEIKKITEENGIHLILGALQNDDITSGMLNWAQQQGISTVNLADGWQGDEIHVLTITNHPGPKGHELYAENFKTLP